MKQSVYTLYILTIALFISCSQKSVKWELRPPAGVKKEIIAIDTMSLRNPFIYLDKENLVYYMTGDNGYLWTSKNMRQWCGPYNILEFDSTLCKGEAPYIESPEIHKHKNRYYYIATFTCSNNITGAIGRQEKPRRSLHIFVSDSIQGPYKPLKEDFPILEADRAIRGATFFSDKSDYGYLIYCNDYTTHQQGNVQVTMLSKDIDAQYGEPYTIIAAANKKWKEDYNSNKEAIDGPFVFRTEGGWDGILFATEYNGEGAVGVAYSSEGGGLNGPWNIEPEPMIKGGYGQAMLFNDFDGTQLMVLHKEVTINGEKKYRPQIFEVDNQYERLIIKKQL